MTISEQAVIASLDNTWRTVPVIKRKIRIPSTTDEICTVLRRMAISGEIEKREQPTSCPKFQRHARGPVLKIEFYRRLQVAG